MKMILSQLTVREFIVSDEKLFGLECDWLHRTIECGQQQETTFQSSKGVFLDCRVQLL